MEHSRNAEEYEIIYEEEAAPMPWMMRIAIYDKDLPEPQLSRSDLSGTPRVDSTLVPSPLLRMKSPIFGSADVFSEEQGRSGSPAPMADFRKRTESPFSAAFAGFPSPSQLPPLPASPEDSPTAPRSEIIAASDSEDGLSNPERELREFIHLDDNLKNVSPVDGEVVIGVGTLFGSKVSPTPSQLDMQEIMWDGGVRRDVIQEIPVSDASDTATSAIIPIKKVHENAKIIQNLARQDYMADDEALDGKTFISGEGADTASFVSSAEAGKIQNQVDTNTEATYSVKELAEILSKQADVTGTSEQMIASSAPIDSNSTGKVSELAKNFENIQASSSDQPNIQTADISSIAAMGIVGSQLASVEKSASNGASMTGKDTETAPRSSDLGTLLNAKETSSSTSMVSSVIGVAALEKHAASSTALPSRALDGDKSTQINEVSDIQTSIPGFNFNENVPLDTHAATTSGEEHDIKSSVSEMSTLDSKEPSRSVKDVINAFEAGNINNQSEDEGLSAEVLTGAAAVDVAGLDTVAMSSQRDSEVVSKPDNIATGHGIAEDLEDSIETVQENVIVSDGEEVTLAHGVTVAEAGLDATMIEEDTSNMLNQADELVMNEVLSKDKVNDVDSDDKVNGDNIETYTDQASTQAIISNSTDDTATKYDEYSEAQDNQLATAQDEKSVMNQSTGANTHYSSIQSTIEKASTDDIVNQNSIPGSIDQATIEGGDNELKSSISANDVANDNNRVTELEAKSESVRNNVNLNAQAGMQTGDSTSIGPLSGVPVSSDDSQAVNEAGSKVADNVISTSDSTHAEIDAKDHNSELNSALTGLAVGAVAGGIATSLLDHSGSGDRRNRILELLEELKVLIIEEQQEIADIVHENKNLKERLDKMN